MSEKHEHITIHINGKEYKAPQPVMTGLQIKELAGGPINYLLVLIVGEPDQVAGGDDKVIGDSEEVHLKSGMRFRIINPATFG